MSERDQLLALARRHRLGEAVVSDLETLLSLSEGPRRNAPDATTLRLGVDDSEEHGPASPPDATGARIRHGSSERYTLLERIGQGGTSAVWRVRDHELLRTMAMKVLDQPEHTRNPRTEARFLSEAQITAQLQHPAIVPVHEIGTLPDGHLYFTMEEVRGRTLHEVVLQVHEASQDVWSRTPDGWSLRRLVEAFRRVCEAVAYAHSRGVVHRDLKPANIMVGEFGDVKVMDWGLARLTAADGGPSGPVETARSRDPDDPFATRSGTIAGTPAFMAPEQALGNLESIDPRTDVWALGATLYFLLKGKPPFADGSAMQVLYRVTYGEPDPLEGRPAGPILPPALVAIVGRAMRKERDERHPNAGVLAAEIADWLDGAERREAALRAVESAARERREAVRLQKDARARRAEARTLTSATPGRASDDAKLRAWALEDDAAALEFAARGHELAMERELGAAFAHVPDLPEAHVALARLTERRHEEAERAGDTAAVERAEAELRHHLAHLAPEWPGRARIAAYLEGRGRLTLHTEPSGATVRVRRYALEGRRLVAGPPETLGRTPLDGVPLAMGSYRLELEHPDRPLLPYPVHVRRGLHWEGGTVHLPATFDPDVAHVAAGPVWIGGDPRARDPQPGTLSWSEAFSIQRDPVTHAAWCAWLQALDDSGGDAEQHVPRREGDGAALYTRLGGRWTLAGEEGTLADPDAPVVGITAFDAEAYAAWLARTDGRPWRLPTEREWEKAARGVDGRSYPWGEHFDPTWCATLDSFDGPAHVVPVGRFPLDVSPYGVRGTAGNVADWCADGAGRTGRFRVVRGGSFGEDAASARCASRFASPPGEWHGHVGVRLVYSLAAMV